jgi:hypothetical protein
MTGSSRPDVLLFGLPDGNLVQRKRQAGVLYDARHADRWENRGIRPAVAVAGRVFGLHDAAGKQAYPAAAQQMILPYPGGFVREDVPAGACRLRTRAGSRTTAR